MQEVVYVELGQYVKFLLIVIAGVDLICDARMTNSSRSMNDQIAQEPCAY